MIREEQRNKTDCGVCCLAMVLNMNYKKVRVLSLFSVAKRIVE